MFLLSGNADRIHTEDIALKAFELFPHSFSWVKYTKFPDKDIVRVALTDARKEKYGALVEGRSGQSKGHSSRTHRSPVNDGWALTENGRDWIRHNLSSLDDHFDLVTSYRQKALSQLKRIRQHRIFQEYLEDPGSFAPSLGMLAELLQCRVDASPEIWEKRFTKLENLAVAIEENSFDRFLAECRKAYLTQR